MSSKKPKPFLIVLDVGHGNAAILHDEGGTVVFDTGEGAHVGHYLDQIGVRKIQAIFLTHADKDHIGGAATLLLNTRLQIGEVLVNSDASKNTHIFRQLCLALADANERFGTKIDRRLVSSIKLKRKGANIEVLHPPDAAALSGVGGKTTSGKRLTSNSMSAAIRVSHNSKSSILLGGDIECDCLDSWKVRKIQPAASALIFPHHGGMPGTTNESEAGLFAFELTKIVGPEFVIFSNHRTKHGNPRDEVITGILKAQPKTRLACTQLPERFHKQVSKTDTWSLHKTADSIGIAEGSICLAFEPSGLRLSFRGLP